MQRVLNRYYKERISGGRSYFARFIDAIALRVLIFLAAWVWFRASDLAGYISVFLSCIVVALASIALKLIREMRFERFIKRERESIAREEAHLKLTTSPEAEFSAAAQRIMREDGVDSKCHAVFIQRLSEVGADDIVKCYREAQTLGACNAVIFASSEVTNEAREIVERLSGINLKLYDAKEIITRIAAAESISDEEIDAIIMRRMEKKRNRLNRMRTGIFSGAQTKRYMILAGVLFALSFISPGGLYIRAIASLSLALAGTSAILERRRG